MIRRDISRPLVFALAVMVTLLVTAPSSADIIKMKDGSVVEGKITEEGEKEITVRVNASVTLRLLREQILSITKQPTAAEEFEKRLATLEPYDVRGLEALALWGKDKGLTDEPRRAWEMILKAEPDHEAARAALGFLRDGEKWVTEDEYRRARGFVRRRGSWVTVEEAALLDRLDAARKRVERLAKDMARNRRGTQKWELAEAELAGTKDPDAEEPLIELLDSRDDDIRLAVCDALGGGSAAPNSKPAIDKLVELALEDEAAGVRNAAGAAASKVGLEAALEALVAALYDTTSSRRRDRAARALGKLGVLDAVPFLIDGLYGVRTKKVREVQEELIPAAVGRRYYTGRVRRRGFVDTPAAYRVRRVVEGYKNFYIFNDAALAALRELTGQDFHYSKEDWFEWWGGELERLEAELEGEDGDGGGEKKPAAPEKAAPDNGGDDAPGGGRRRPGSDPRAPKDGSGS